MRGAWLLYSTCPAAGMSPHNTRAGRMAHFLLSSHARLAADHATLTARCAEHRAEDGRNEKRAGQPRHDQLSVFTA